MTATAAATAAKRLHDYKVLSFDCYGTLIDWESGIIAGLQPLTTQLSPPLSRDEILQAHAKFESSQQMLTPTMLYADVLAAVYRQLANVWGIAVTDEQCKTYGHSVGQWHAFEDSADALRYLKQHYVLVILSNTDEMSFAGSCKKLQTEFDAVYTAETVGAYKPADKNFVYLIEQLTAKGFDKTDILHTAESVFHDHIPATNHGVDCCHIYRRHNQPGFGATMTPAQCPPPAFCFNSMAALVAAHQHGA